MTIYTESVRLHAASLAKARESASALAKATRDAIARARTYRDPNLTDQGLAEKRTELEKEFRDAARVDFEKISGSISAARTYLLEQARENAKLPNDAAALIRGEQKWHQVERLLDAGQDLHSVLRGADADTARAIAEFGPSWAAARFHRPEGIDGAVRSWMGETPEQATDSLQRAVYARLGAIEADTAARDLFTAAAAADAQAAPAQPWIDASRSLIEHGRADMLGAALASQVAAPAEPAGSEAA